MSNSPESPRKVRLDELLVERGLAESRSQAKRLIMAGRVREGDHALDKPGKVVSADIAITLKQPPRFVGRGGEKLEHFLKTFGLDFAGCTVLDIGASTGGFTDCALQRGAKTVTCVDVGRAQLHPKIAGDPRVINIEKTNARNLQPGDLPLDCYDRIVIDVSFISLRLILPAVWSFLSPGGNLVALVKPQFEADRKTIAKGSGVIRSEETRHQILKGIEEFALKNLPGAEKTGAIPSPIQGADGNVEFLLGLLKRMPGQDAVPPNRVL